MTGPDKLEIDRVVFIGRTADEYRRMFALDEPLLHQGAILDCAAGPSSFTATGHRAGLKVVACDLCYDLPVATLARQGAEDIDHVFSRFDQASHLYTWDYYRDKEAVIAHRRQALAEFVNDFPAGREEGRYQRAELPRLAMADRAFALVLCSHFLFLYGDRLDPEFHRATLKELMRVAAGEVRIFPLQGLDAKPYPHLAAMLDFLSQERIAAEIVSVPFEFQRGSNQMLRLRRMG